MVFPFSAIQLHRFFVGLFACLILKISGNVCFYRFHHAVNDRTGIGSERRVAKEKIIPSNNNRLDRLLASFIVDLHWTVLQEHVELLPMIQTVCDRLPEQSFRQYPQLLRL